MQWEVTVASVVVVVFDGSDDDGLVFVIMKFFGMFGGHFRFVLPAIGEYDHL